MPSSARLIALAGERPGQLVGTPDEIPKTINDFILSGIPSVVWPSTLGNITINLSPPIRGLMLFSSKLSLFLQPKKMGWRKPSHFCVRI
jgi:hypothetical protein